MVNLIGDALAFGLDYSASEVLPDHYDNVNAGVAGAGVVDCDFGKRYIGYPTNPKCISFYKGAYRRFVDAGKKIYLCHQIGYNDFGGGYAAGRRHAGVALKDAEAVGYDDRLPIACCFDRFLAGNPAKGIPPLSLGQVYDYVDGFQSLVTWDRSELYGFFDVIHPAIRDGLARYTWLCGAGSNVRRGVTFWQFNNGYVYPAGLQADLNIQYEPVVAAGNGGGGGVIIPEQRRRKHMSDLLGLVVTNGETEKYPMNWACFVKISDGTACWITPGEIVNMRAEFKIAGYAVLDTPGHLMDSRLTTLVNAEAKAKLEVEVDIVGDGFGKV